MTREKTEQLVSSVENFDYFKIASLPRDICLTFMWIA
jgi:hypothetical protein